MKDLNKEYTAEFSHLDEETWHRIINLFQDAKLYQTLSYDIVRFGQKRVVHMVLRKGNTVVAAAQARIYRLPVINTGIAYVMRGPMWRPKGVPADKEVFRQAIRALRNEFSSQRSFVLRIFPHSYRGIDGCIEQMLFDEGYQMYKNDEMTNRTLVIDLDPSLAELRAGLEQKWRNCLNRAEKNSLELILGEEECLFDEFKVIFDKMVKRKGWSEPSDLNHLRLVLRDLPQNLKLKIVLCRLNGELAAGAIFSAIGNSGEYLSGATSQMGMKTNGSYLIQWTFVKWLKENGFRFYDLNGINPNNNPGTYHFKRGLAGKHGEDIEFLGKYQVTDSLMSSFVVKGGEGLMSGYKKIVRSFRSLRDISNKEILEK